MEQCVARLDVAMFNALLRESTSDIPTDPVSDPISEPKVLPVPAGSSSFGEGAQLKNALKQNGWIWNFALESSYISLPWWAGQTLFGTLTLDVVVLTLLYTIAGMQGAIGSFLLQGKSIKTAAMHHLRVATPLMRPSLFQRFESTSSTLMEEHGFESTTTADILKVKVYC